MKSTFKFSRIFILMSCPVLSRSVVSDSLRPQDCSPPGSSVHGIFQAGILEWVVISYSRDLPKAEIKHTSLVSPALAGGFFTISSTWKALIGCPYFLSLFKYNVSCYKLSMPRSIHSLGLQKWCHSCSLCIS